MSVIAYMETAYQSKDDKKINKYHLVLEISLTVFKCISQVYWVLIKTLANLENLLELYLVIDYWYFQLNNLLFLVPINAHTL